MNYANFGSRLIAYIIDGLIISVAAAIISIVPIVGWIVSAVVGWFYFALMECTIGQTFGKRLMKIKVIDQYGLNPTFGRATGRYFAKILSGLILCIGYIMAAFTERRQALHDMICDTYVVTEDEQQPLPPFADFFQVFTGR